MDRPASGRRYPPARLRALSVIAPALVMALASCEPAGGMPGGDGGLRGDYLVARQALETGNYDLAARRYAQVMGAVAEGSARRIELEYAHSLLRADRHDEAIAVASRLGDAADGSIRASALAVRGTARHEAARRAIDAGNRGPETRALLEAARADLTGFLRQTPGLDSAGSMRARAELIAADLAGLG